jgi:hypothetical protein
LPEIVTMLATDNGQPTHGLSHRMRCLLHRHFNLFSDSRDAHGQAGRGAMRSAD